MSNTQIIILISIVWLTCGYIGWHLRYFGLMKSWYEKYGYTENLAEESQAKHWSYGLPLLLFGGILSILVLLKYPDDIAWYFKQPKK